MKTQKITRRMTKKAILDLLRDLEEYREATPDKDNRPWGRRRGAELSVTEWALLELRWLRERLAIAEKERGQETDEKAKLFSMLVDEEEKHAWMRLERDFLKQHFNCAAMLDVENPHDENLPPTQQILAMLKRTYALEDNVKNLEEVNEKLKQEVEECKKYLMIGSCPRCGIIFDSELFEKRQKLMHGGDF